MLVAGEFVDIESDKLFLNFPAVHLSLILWVHLASDCSQIVPDTPESVFHYGAVHILRQPGEGGCLANADHC